jgi:hypothetical protein
MSAIKFDKERYLRIARSEGINAALTALQTDMIRWEYEAFEGEKGYQPEILGDLDEVRLFSRQLWDQALDEPGSSKTTGTPG